MISFFWYNGEKLYDQRWSLRGMSFTTKYGFINIRFHELLFRVGATKELKLKIGLRSWKLFLRLLWKEILQLFKKLAK